MTHSLRTLLLLVFVSCIALLALTQIGVRYFVELPALKQIEHRNDVQIVEQLRHSLALDHVRKQFLASDNAHWTRAYEFMSSERGDPFWETFVAEEFEHVYTMHAVPRVDGYIYFKLDGEVLFQSAFDHQTQVKGQPFALSLAELSELLPAKYDDVTAGFINSPAGTQQIAVSGVSDDEATIAPRGYLVVWRNIDQAYFNTMLGREDMVFEPFKPGSHREVAASILASEGGVLPRDESSELQWMLYDAFGEPLFLVRQPAPPRVFNEGLVSRAGVLASIAAVFLLMLFSAVVSRRVVGPIATLSDFAQARAVDEDFNQRLDMRRGDEIGVVARQFDQLLERVDYQARTLKARNATLEALVDHDPLTGLYNRRAFDRLLARSWSNARRHGMPISCVIVDVDWFGSFNKHYGHQAGDEALKRVAQALGDSVHRATDTVCRYGGEEFIVILDDTGDADAKVLADKMLAAIRALGIPHAASSTGFIVIASAGVATLTPEREDLPESLIRLADEALKQAKTSGRDQIAA